VAAGLALNEVTEITDFLLKLLVAYETI